MHKKYINYEKLIDISMHNIVREALKSINNGVAPGNHHFYLSFFTQAPGVKIPEHLKILYPQEMTIVLQYQFEDLEVRKNDFSVSLTFNGKKSYLTISFKALTSFTDPSVNFAIKFRYFEKSFNNKTQPMVKAKEDKKSTVHHINTPPLKKISTKKTKQTNNIIQFSKIKK